MTPTDKFVEAMRIWRQYIYWPGSYEDRALHAAVEAFADAAWPEGVSAPNAQADYRASLLKRVMGGDDE